MLSANNLLELLPWKSNLSLPLNFWFCTNQKNLWFNTNFRFHTNVQGSKNNRKLVNTYKFYDSQWAILVSLLNHEIKVIQSTKYKLSAKLFVIKIKSPGIYNYFNIIISDMTYFAVIKNSILKAYFNPKIWFFSWKAFLLLRNS